MVMAPFPVSILVAPMGSHILVMAPVIVGEIDSPGMVLAVIPVVVVLVVTIVDSNLERLAPWGAGTAITASGLATAAASNNKAA